MTDDGLTEEKFLAMSKQLMEFLKRIKEGNDTMITQLRSEIKTLQGKISSDNDTNTKNLKGMSDANIASILKKFDVKSAEIDQVISEIKNGENGVDADEDIITDKVLGRIKIPTIEELKNDLPKMKEEVRDAFELLEGDERPNISVIKGLRSYLRKLEERLNGNLGRVSGGGLNVSAINIRFIDDEILTGTINGTNKDFTIAHSPSPVTSLKIYRGGARQRITEDYTFSGTTVSFLVAPVTGEILTGEYRVG